VRLPIECATNQRAIDSAVAAFRAAGFEREQYARYVQRTLDSIAAEVRIRSAVDSILRTTAVARERARVDSSRRADAARREAAIILERSLARGVYAGVAGGTSVPQRDLRRGYVAGWNVTVPIGWDASGSPFGFRGDISVDRLSGSRARDVLATAAAPNGGVTIWSVNADAKVRLPAPGAPSRTTAYVLGGIGAHRLTKGVYGISGLDAGQSLRFGNAGTSFGWNIGGGVSMAWGSRDVFIESRFFEVRSDLGFTANGGVGPKAPFTPIVVGMQWF
jgi:opacity protein-like surface antigen